MTEHRPIPVRLDDETIERLDRLAAQLSERAAGTPISRSAALRTVVERGLVELEAELRPVRRKK